MGGLEVDQARRLMALEREKQRLLKALAALTLDLLRRKEAVEENHKAEVITPARFGSPLSYAVACFG